MKVSVLSNLLCVLVSTWQHLCIETLHVKKLVTWVMVWGGGVGVGVEESDEIKYYTRLLLINIETGQSIVMLIEQ